MGDLLVRTRDVAIGGLPIAALVAAVVLAFGAAGPGHRRSPLSVAAMASRPQQGALPAGPFRTHLAGISEHR